MKSPIPGNLIDQAVRVHRALKVEKEFYDHLRTGDLYPHAGQKLLLKLVFQVGKKDVGFQCGRNFGKSHGMALVHGLFAATRPGSQCYIIAPLRQQAYEIYCASGLVKSIIPPHLLLDGDEGFNKSELRFQFKNDSFIKIDGADNESGTRGIKGHLVGCDEFQDWKGESYRAMEPNLIAKDAAVIKLWTPPDIENFCIQHANFMKKEIARGNKRYFFMQQPTSMNPRLPRERLEEIRRGYIERGEEEVWRREYMAEFVPGGASAIFKTFSQAENVRPMEWIFGRLKKDLSKCEYWTIADPGSTSVFAVAFLIRNPATEEVFLLDELYELDDKLTSTGQIWPRVQMMEKRFTVSGKPWIRLYDEAAAWFQKELANQFPDDCGVTPTRKAAYERESQYEGDSCSVVKDAFVQRKFFISDRCTHTISELTNYHKDDRGKIARNQPDHMIDCIRYFFHESGWSSARAKIQVPTEHERGFSTPADDREWVDEEEAGFLPSTLTGDMELELDDSLWN